MQNEYVINFVKKKTPTVSANITKQILESKRPNIAEIELTLFENCNIECDFCFHDKKSMIGLTLHEMNEKLPIIEQFMKDKQGSVELMQINMVGGELFQDRWMVQICNDYYELATDIAALAKKYNHRLRIVWVSNFLFVNRESVHLLLSKLRNNNIDTHLIASYDFDGRPMSKNYRNNIDWFGPEFIISINSVGTKKSILSFINNDDVYFDYLYDTFPIYFDDFIPDKGSDESIPSDTLMYEWYMYVATHYPKISPMAELISNENNPMHCLSLNKITIFPNNSTSNCRWYRYDQNDFNTELDMHDNSGMMQNYLDELGCLSCDYYQRCGFRCFTQWDWKNRKSDMNTCPMKSFFNEITK